MRSVWPVSSGIDGGLLPEAEPHLHAALPPGHRSGRRVLLGDVSGGHLRVDALDLVDPQREAVVLEDGGRVLHGPARQVGHAHLTRADRDTHGRRRRRCTKVPSSAAASTSSFPAPQTRVLNNMQTEKCTTGRVTRPRGSDPVTTPDHDGAEERLEAVPPGPGAEMAGLVDQIAHAMSAAGRAAPACQPGRTRDSARGRRPRRPRSPRARSSMSRRRGVRRAGPLPRRARACAAAPRPAGEVGRRTPPPDFRLAPNRARGRSRARPRSTQSNTGPNGSGRLRSICTMDARLRAQPGQRLPQQVDSPAANVPGHDDAFRRRPRAGMRDALAPGRGAGVEHPLAGRRERQARDRLRRLVLQHEHAARRPAACAAGCPRSRRGRPGRRASGGTRRRARASACCERRARRAQRVRAEGQAARRRC